MKYNYLNNHGLTEPIPKGLTKILGVKVKVTKVGSIIIRTRLYIGTEIKVTIEIKTTIRMTRMVYMCPLKQIII